MHIAHSHLTYTDARMHAQLTHNTYTEAHALLLGDQRLSEGKSTVRARVDVHVRDIFACERSRILEVYSQHMAILILSHPRLSINQTTAIQ